MDRFLARLIDWFIWGALYFVSSALVGLFDLELDISQAITLVVFATFVLAYESYMVSSKGATIGKRFLGLRLVPLGSLEAGRPTVGSGASRLVLFWLAVSVSATGFAFLDSGIGGIGLVVLVVPLVLHGMVSFRNDGFRRTTWDHVADTVVVKNYE